MWQVRSAKAERLLAAAKSMFHCRSCAEWWRTWPSVSTGRGIAIPISNICISPPRARVVLYAVRSVDVWSYSDCHSLFTTASCWCLVLFGCWEVFYLHCVLTSCACLGSLREKQTVHLSQQMILRHRGTEFTGKCKGWKAELLPASKIKVENGWKREKSGGNWLHAVEMAVWKGSLW